MLLGRPMLGPDADLSFDPPITVFNLSGGVSCLSGASGTCWLMLPSAQGIFWTALQPFTIPDPLNSLAPLRILTQSHFNSAEELHDPLESTSLFLRNTSGVSFDVEQSNRWTGLSTAYINRRETFKAKRAERIGTQIRFCRNTLDALIKSYRSALTVNLVGTGISHPDDGEIRFTADKHSIDIGYRTQSCLNELYALRDFIMYFLFEDLYGRKISLSKASELLKSDDRFGLAAIITPLINRDSPMGRIALTSLYRNVFFHYTGSQIHPLGPMYCFRECSGPLGFVPYLLYPLYDNIERLKSIERGRITDDDGVDAQREEAIRFMKLSTQTDALELCYDTFVDLLVISKEVEKQIQITSENIVIKDSDILEATLRDADGKVTHFKRNSDGELEKSS
jgi:hypothetical protein